MLEYDIVSDGKTLCTQAVQKAVDECSANGGGIVRFDRGRYVLSTVFLHSNVTIEIPEGIILEAMIEGYAEYYSTDLAQKVSRGMRESSIKGQYTGGFVLFGYRQIGYISGLIDLMLNYVTVEGEINYPLNFVDWHTYETDDEIQGVRAINIIAVKKGNKTVKSFWG